MKRRIVFSLIILVLMLSVVIVPVWADTPTPTPTSAPTPTSTPTGPGFKLVVNYGTNTMDEVIVTGTYSCINEAAERTDFNLSGPGTEIYGHDIKCLGELTFRINPYCCTDYYKGGTLAWNMKLWGDGAPVGYYSDYDMQPSEDMITFHGTDTIPASSGTAPPSTKTGRAPTRGPLTLIPMTVTESLEWPVSLAA